MAGDLFVFLRGEDLHRAERSGTAYGIVWEPVPSFVEAEAEPGQAATDLRPRFRSFSPMPPVNTSRSSPPSAAIIAAICLRTE